MDSMSLAGYIAKALTSFYGVCVIIVAIISWAILAARRFSSRMTPIEVQLQIACKLLNNYSSEERFAAHFHDFDKDIRNIELIRHPWHEFYKALLPAPDESPPVVFNTQGADAFFSREAFLGNRINIRFYNALPNLLTGAGILGTFVGLVAGIYLASGGLASPHVADAKEALQNLLHGASLAFWTSIAGLLASILFSWREKHTLHRLEGFRHQWVSGLDARLQRLTPEKIARDTQKDVRQQTASLEQFTTELAFQVAQAFEEKISAPMAPVLDRLVTAVEGLRSDQGRSNDDLLLQVVQRFTDSISGAAGQEMTAFGATVRELTEKLDRQVGQISERSERMEQASRESIRVLGDVFQEGGDKLRDQVSASVGEITSNLGAVVAEMSAQLRQASTSIADRNEQMDKASRESLQAMGDAFQEGGARFREQVSASVGEITTSLGDTATRMAQLLRSASEDAANSMRQISKTFEESVSRVGNTLDSIREITLDTRGVMTSTQALLGSVQTTHGQVAGLGDSLREVATDISGSAQESRRTAETIATAVSQVSATVRQLDDSHSRIKDVWAQYQGRFEAVDASLARVFSEIEAGLGRYASTVKEFVEGLDTHTSSITRDLAGAVGELHEAVEDLRDTVGRRRPNG